MTEDKNLFVRVVRKLSLRMRSRAWRLAGGISTTEIVWCESARKSRSSPSEVVGVAGALFEYLRFCCLKFETLVVSVRWCNGAVVAENIL